MKSLVRLGLAIVTLCTLGVSGLHAAEHRVLVVMSYEQDNPWCREIRQGIDSVLAGSSQVTYFDMDTNKSFFRVFRDCPAPGEPEGP